MFARKLTESCAFLRPKAESDLVERLQNGMLEVEEAPGLVFRVGTPEISGLWDHWGVIQPLL